MVYAYPKCKNIVVDDYSKAYRDEVVRYLDLIATTDVGRILYDFMGKTTKTVRITWTLGTSWTETGVTTFTDADLRRVLEAAERISRLRRIPIEDAIDAAMREDVALSAKTKGRYAKDHPVMQRLRIDIFAALGLHSTFQVPTTDIGTGEGADCELDYHPAAFLQIIKNTGNIGIGFGPGEALYHELVHAFRDMAGVVMADNVPERFDMDDFEEFCGILAANMYRSARGFTRLRFDHQVADRRRPWLGATELPGVLRDPKRYFEEFKPEIVKWFSSQRAFCVALAGSCAPFNPMAVAADELGIAIARC